MGWVKITCAERDEIMGLRDLVPFSSCTDLDAEFHSEPEVFTEWGDRGTDLSVLQDYRYPARMYVSDDPLEYASRPDRKPCEHYQWEPPAPELPDDPDDPAAVIRACAERQSDGTVHGVVEGMVKRNA